MPMGRSVWSSRLHTHLGLRCTCIQADNGNKGRLHTALDRQGAHCPRPPDLNPARELPTVISLQKLAARVVTSSSTHAIAHCQRKHIILSSYTHVDTHRMPSRRLSSAFEGDPFVSTRAERGTPRGLDRREQTDREHVSETAVRLPLTPHKRVHVCEPRSLPPIPLRSPSNLVPFRVHLKGRLAFSGQG
eukprot:1178058-Prorocentrum_minimum.AAC.4